jgi:[ribosomal protein S5]-alanine N-acetyltransferase
VNQGDRCGRAAKVEIATRRLHLIAATHNLLEADLHDRAELCRSLGAAIPPDWPPPLNDEETTRYTLSYLAANPDAVGWASWYFIRNEPPEKRVVVGLGGFHSKPSADGTVEVGYSLIPQFQRMGYATEAVEGLLAWAFGHPDVRRVTAKTLSDLIASNAVLERTGFSRFAQPPEPDEPKSVVSFVKERST